ncbi:MAG: EamA family transporter [Dehalococcoidia bacterium]|nr:EamA family transporter [Dehalococcoidia bacterium]
MAYLYVLGTVLLSVYGSLILKWRISLNGELPSAFPDNIIHILRICIDPFVISGFAAAGLAVLLWIAALSKLQLSQAYPFVSLSFALILIFSVILFHEPINLWKISSVILIVAGIVLGSQG